MREKTESADYVPFNNSAGPAAVNILAAAVRTNPAAELIHTHRGPRGRDGHRSHFTNSLAYSLEELQQPPGPNKLSFLLCFRRHCGIFTSLAHSVEKSDINVRRMQWRSQYFGRAEPQRFQVLFPFIRALHDNEAIRLR